jgi:WD40 repeat protein/class 3 adenylate cyclase
LSTANPETGAVRRAFLIADVRGYSTFTRERGDEAAARMASRFAELARDAALARSGMVIELRGDEALAVFESSAQAVRAALEFQEACGEEADSDPEVPLPVGIGVAAGDAVPVEDGYRGAALNLAARLCSKATAGQVLVAAPVARAVRSEPDLEFRPLDPVELKGFEGPVELFEARSTVATSRMAAGDRSPATELPTELDDATPLVGRDHELRWLRGTWRQAGRGRGRVVFVSGAAGTGRTRLAGALAAYAAAGGADVRYAGPGGTGAADAVAAVARATEASAPTIVVLDDLHLHPEAVERLADAAGGIEHRPTLVIATFLDGESEGNAALTGLVESTDLRGDAHRTLGPLALEDVIEIARLSVGELRDEFPAEAILRTSGGVPARIHEAIDDWARAEASRRLTAAAEWLAEGRTRQAAGMDLAGTLIARNLGRIYSVSTRQDDDGACPYRGLASFGQDDAQFFFGRERLVGEVAARTVGTGLLGVVGPSGSGKSSLVMAGLLPSLAAGLLPGSKRWGQVVVRPGEHPLDALETALVTARTGTRLVVVVDQFEETFTTAADEDERAAFVGRLTELAADPEAFAVVLTMRADYTGHCAPYPELARLLSANLVLVGPMSPEETRRAIDLPARRAGLRVESALTAALVGEVGDEPGALPLLSTALVELWRARNGGWMRLAARERTGGVRGAVARLAETSYEGLSPSERDAARTILLRLVGEGEGESAVRRRVEVSEFDVERDPDVAAVLERLTEDRLLTRDDGQVEIAHEALIREWPRLRDWLDEDAAGRQLRLHLTQAARQWSDRGRDPADLYRGARLSASLDWAGSHGRDLNELEREFLAEGRQAGEREADHQRRVNRRLRGLLVGTAVFLVVAVVAGSLALVQRGHARSAQAAAEAQALRSDAERVGTLARTEPSLDRSMLLAVAGVRLEGLPETRSDLLSVLQADPDVIRVIHASPTGVTGLAASRDGGLLATGDEAGVVRFHDLRSSRQVGDPVDVGGPVSENAVVYSPDGTMVAVGTAAAGRVNLVVVDVASRVVTTAGSWPSVPASAGPVRFIRLAFSPDSRRIAVAVATSKVPLPVPVGQRLLLVDPKGTVLWDRAVPLQPGQNEAQVEFRPDGTIVTSAQQGKTLLWDQATGSVLRTYDVGGPFALSPDGTRAAVARNNDNPFAPTSGVDVLDLETGAHHSLGDLPAAAWIITLGFAQADLSDVVVRSFDGVVRVWNIDTGSIDQTFDDLPSGLLVDVVPGTDVALTASQDGTVIATDVGGADRLGRTFRWHGPKEGCAITPCFVIDPAGRLLAESLSRGRTGLLDLRTGRSVGMLPPTNGPDATALALSPDGTTLVTGGSAGTATIWNVADRSATGTVRYDGRVWWLAVSPDGKLLAAQWKAGTRSASTVEVRTMAGGRTVFTASVPNGKGGLEFSPDGRSLAALGCCEPGSTVEVWDTRTWTNRFRLAVGGQASSIAYSPDGRVLGVGTADGSVVLFDAGTGKQAGAPIKAATGPVDPISFSPDGRLVAASSNDQTLTLWDLRSRKRLGTTFPVEEAAVPSGSFDPRGDLVIEYVTDMAIWPTDLRRWTSFACAVAGRDLRPEEWRDLLPDRPYRHVCPG